MLIVVVGAPIVEELVYRGLLQRSLTSVVNAGPALVIIAMWFSLIHLSPVEYPGLFLAGLVFGAGVVADRADRSRDRDPRRIQRDGHHSGALEPVSAGD